MSVPPGDKVLIISTGEVTKNVDLVFSFPGQGVDPSLVWRSNRFDANVNQTYTIVYTPKLCILEPTVQGAQIVGEKAMTDISIGYQTSFVAHGSTESDYFTTPTPGAPGMLTVKNTSKNPVDIVLGFQPEVPGQMNVAQYFANVKSEHSLSINWKPSLCAYAFIDSQYLQNEIVGEFGAPPIWEQDLEELKPVSEWILTADGYGYKLVPASQE